MTSSMAYVPEPLALYAQHVEGPPGQADGVVRVVDGNGAIVAQATPADYVSVSITELKLRGHDHRTHVVIASVSGGAAWNGSIEQHSA